MSKPKGFLKLDGNISSENSKWIEENFSYIYCQIREQIAQEIEEYRVMRCRCEQTLKEDCDALINAADIARGQK